MKSTADLILELQHAPVGNRKFDIAIGEIMGYTRQVKGKKKVVWLYAVSGEERDYLPYFTAKLDAAQYLAQSLVPGCIGGITWGPRNSSARLDDGPIFTASTPTLALCAAALSARYIEKTNGSD